MLTGVAVSTGDEVAEGARLVEVSGRPVFVFEGEVPVYRSLRPGMSGADVAQMQAALERLGFVPDTDGTFGEATKVAINDFYGQAGYVPVPSSPTEAADRAAAEQAVFDAEQAVATARAAVDAAGAGQPGSVVAQATAARNSAQRAVNDAEAARVSELALARQARDVAVAERDRVAADPAAEAGALTVAQLALDQAQAQLDQTDRATRGAVDSAKEALWIAALALNEVNASGETALAQAGLDAAVTVRDRARAALDAVVATTGPTVAQGEVVFVPTLPARVQQVASVLGALDGSPDQAGGSTGGSAALATLAGGGLVVSMTLRTAEVGLVRAGMQVELLDEQSNTTYQATISEIAEAAVTGVDGASGVPVTIVADDPLPDSLAGVNLRVTITAASTETASLVVPLAAVSSGADGATYVSILPTNHAGAEPVTVAVTTGLSADGFVAVEPVAAGTLVAGDRVVVGR